MQATAGVETKSGHFLKAGFWLLLSSLLAGSSARAENVGPWDLQKLKQPPAMQWFHQTGPVHSLQYTGEEYQGRPTQVFALYASPATLDPSRKGETFPGVVLIHGGGGTAFAEWVYLWAERGYAAIAMDLAGHRPRELIYDAVTGKPVFNQAVKPETRVPLTEGGPNQGHAQKFDSIGGDHTDDWPFHAAANGVLAHSLLRSFEEVDSQRTAITGISWGGYTTCLVAALDDRFQAAVPVYGCGFLYEGESVQKPAIDQLGDRRQQWIEEYDPSRLLPRCRVPIFFVNGTNDVHYPLDSYQKTYQTVPGNKQMRIEVNMRHSHPAGWESPEIGLFIDAHCRGAAALPVPGELKKQGSQLELTYTSAVPLQSAQLHYTTETGLRSARNWITVPAEIQAGKIRVAAPPENANTWFLSLIDNRNAMVTTPVQFQAEE